MASELRSEDALNIGCTDLTLLAENPENHRKQQGSDLPDPLLSEAHASP
jgi:hypothetical protein